MLQNKTIPLLVLTLTVVTATLVIGINSISTVKADSRADIFGHVVSGQATTQTQGSFGQGVASAAHQLGGLSCNSINVNNGVGCGPSLNP